MLLAKFSFLLIQLLLWNEYLYKGDGKINEGLSRRTI